MAQKRRRRNNDDSQGIMALLFLVGMGVFTWYQQGKWLELGAATLFGVTVLVILIVTALIAQRARLTRRGLLQLTPTEFEERIALLMRDMGWHNVQRVGGSGDQGVDVKAQKDGETWVVQCKRYKGAIPPAHVREMVGVKQLHKADNAVIATPSTFTAQGKSHAATGNIILWDGNQLAHMIAQIDAARRSPAQRNKIPTFIALVTLLNVGMIIVLVVKGFHPLP